MRQMNLKNKIFLIFGIVNKKSIAYAVAKNLFDQGAKLYISYQNDSLSKRVLPICKELNATSFICDVSKESEIKQVFDKLASDEIKLDGLIHSLAFAPMNTLEARFCETDREGFLTGMNISVYSLIQISNFSRAVMKTNSSILTMSYLGAQRVMPSYKIMGPIKAALESSVKYLAEDLGEFGIRVNAISAGPIKTIASSAFGGMNKNLEKAQEKSPLRINIDQEDVANLSVFLLSYQARGITGGIHFVDAGLNILGE